VNLWERETGQRSGHRAMQSACASPSTVHSAGRVRCERDSSSQWRPPATGRMQSAAVGWAAQRSTRDSAMAAGGWRRPPPQYASDRRAQPRARRPPTRRRPWESGQQRTLASPGGAVGAARRSRIRRNACRFERCSSGAGRLSWRREEDGGTQRCGGAGVKRSSRRDHPHPAACHRAAALGCRSRRLSEIGLCPRSHLLIPTPGRTRLDRRTGDRPSGPSRWRAAEQRARHMAGRGTAGSRDVGATSEGRRGDSRWAARTGRNDAWRVPSRCVAWHGNGNDTTLAARPQRRAAPTAQRCGHDERMDGKKGKGKGKGKGEPNRVPYHRRLRWSRRSSPAPPRAAVLPTTMHAA
jgi:hypothetical protein